MPYTVHEARIMGANTKYKDSVFSFLFSNGDLLREKEFLEANATAKNQR
jgi:hypothetical protein